LAPDSKWEIYQADILEPPEGTWEVVYAWGSLHHTGDMWQACENVSRLLTPGGTLAISIYNDQGWVSRLWWILKRSYVSVPLLRLPLLLLTFVLTWGPTFARECLAGRNPVRKWRAYGDRGMAAWTDLVDWAGGYPYEYASFDDVVRFFEARGMRLQRMKSVRRNLGCNEFVFAAPS
jgi:2-polyprenyl-6-hydroxyphenyl methylase/3-demethylubiquinone-9 3-methyltransferase